MKNLKVESQMTPYPVTVSPQTSLNQALALMEENKVRHLPVLDQGEVVGVVSERDIQKMLILADSMQILVKDVMAERPYTVTERMPLAEVAKVMADHKYGAAVVTDDFRRVVGIFTTTDGMRILSQLLDENDADSNRLRLISLKEYFTHHQSRAG